jgi:cytochrome c oxidase assembly factor CtaG/polyferredoxin
MDPLAAAVLGSWRSDAPLMIGFAAAALIYLRGWSKLRRELPARYTGERLASFLAGLATVLVALESPLDAFAGFLLEAHMVQHLLLIMVAPPLIWLGQPVIPLLRGLPGGFLREGLGPFLRWRALRRVGQAVTHPVFCWCAMTVAVVFWHLPRWYDLGLSSPEWHKVEHGAFLAGAMLFWYPVVGVWPSRPQWPRAMMIPYLVLADFVNTALSAWLVFSDHVVYRTYELAPRMGDTTALHDQAGAGTLMWVPGSIAYLIPAFAIAMQAFSGKRASREPVRRVSPMRRAEAFWWDIRRLPGLRRALQTLMLLVALAVIADGLVGPQAAPLNLAGVLPWTWWRGLTVLALLAAGNLFCMACPFMLVRDGARRFFPAKLRWPSRLRNKWLAAGLVALYLWAYDAFRLWDSPWWTAWLIIGYFLAALTVDAVFQGASFCKYVCPIGQFHFVNSLVSPLEVGVRDAAVCTSCTTHDCLRGNASHSGCELQLFQPAKQGNFDCTFCLDCVHSCPSGNVGIAAVRKSAAPKRVDVAVLLLALIFGGFLNALAMTGEGMRWINGLEGALGSLPLAMACFYLAGWGLIAAGVATAFRNREQLAGFASALVPLGAGMWTAHFLYHVAVGWHSLEPLLARFVTIPGGFAMAAAPDWLRGAQLLILDAALLWALYLVWRRNRSIVCVAAAVALYCAGVWIVFQPMEMRGMLMPS